MAFFKMEIINKPILHRFKFNFFNSTMNRIPIRYIMVIFAKMPNQERCLDI
jgi:hypothetical protein